LTLADVDEPELCEYVLSLRVPLGCAALGIAATPPHARPWAETLAGASGAGPESVVVDPGSACPPCHHAAQSHHTDAWARAAAEASRDAELETHRRLLREARETISILEAKLDGTLPPATFEEPPQQQRPELEGDRPPETTQTGDPTASRGTPDVVLNERERLAPDL